MCTPHLNWGTAVTYLNRIQLRPFEIRLRLSYLQFLWRVFLDHLTVCTSQPIDSLLSMSYILWISNFSGFLLNFLIADIFQAD